MTEAPPPSGGMGGHDAEPSSLPFGPTATPLRRSSLVRRLVVLFGVVIVFGICGGVSIRLYVNRAKTMEARLNLRKIAKQASAVYARDGKLCPSATASVPAKPAPAYGKYQSRVNEWKEAGFDCLDFEIPGIQYFQYSYVATEHGFVATARGTVLDDGSETVMTATGEIGPDRLLVVKKP